MERLVKTLLWENGQLFYILSGRRILLAECEPEIRIYEHTERIDAIGGYGVKSYHAALVLCGHPQFTRSIDAAFLRKIECYDLSADIQRQDGIFENYLFHALQPVEIDPDGEWTFSLNETPDRLRKLLAL